MFEMEYFGEIIALSVAALWTATALFSEVASKRLGTLPFNVVRMSLSLVMLGVALWWFTGSPYPLLTDFDTWWWMVLSGVVGYVIGDYCLFNSYIIIGSRFGQLFMTLAPPAAAISAWCILGESLTLKSLAGMLVTLTGIGISVVNKGGDKGKKLNLKLPLRGVLFGIGAGVCQGLGLVLSKVGMNYYELAINLSPVTDNTSNIKDLLPFASTFIRAATGVVGFTTLLFLRREHSKLPSALKDFKGMRAASLATLTGPFIGVSLSLMAVQYTEAGIASTLMALTPILILYPAHLIFKQKISTKEVVGAVISVIGVALFFV